MANLWSPWHALHARQAAGWSAGLVDLRDGRARMCEGDGLGGRSGVGCQILFRRRCDRPWLDAAGSLREVNDAVLVARGPFPVWPARAAAAQPP